MTADTGERLQFAGKCWIFTTLFDRVELLVARSNAVELGLDLAQLHINAHFQWRMLILVD